MDDTEHIAERPFWDCLRCGKPWPCDPVREDLAATHSPTALAMTMWVQFEEAVGDMPTVPGGEMLERFLSWTWQASRSAHSGGT